MATIGEQAGQQVKQTMEQLKARIAELEAQANARKTQGLVFKVGPKGGICIYGLQRYPFTGYVEQWDRIFAAKAQYDQFVKDHASELKRKEV